MEQERPITRPWSAGGRPAGRKSAVRAGFGTGIRVQGWGGEAVCNIVFCTLVATVLGLAMDGTVSAGYYVVAYGIGFCVQTCNCVGRVWGPAWCPRLLTRVVATGCGLAAGLVLGGALVVGRPLFLLGDSTVLSIAVLVGVMAFVGFELLRHLWDTRDRLFQAELDALTRGKALAESELRVLQAQVEPHFLFNTLANVISLIETRPARAARLLRGLTSWLRASLSQTRRLDGTLGEELEMVRAYLDIQALRMGGRLTHEVRADPGLDGVRMPPLLVQPLVENAVRHGIEPSETGGRVEVRALRRGGGVQVRVTDDGVGLNPETAERGVGLANVRERVRASFGEDGRLAIWEAPGKGVRVELSVPAAALNAGGRDDGEVRMSDGVGGG